MSKQAAKKRVADNEAYAIARSLRTSPRKLNLVAQLIRNLKVSDALIQLQFCERRIAQDVRKVLQSAVANAENNFGLNVDKLYVREATVGRGIVMKRFNSRGRGRAARIEKPFSNLTLIVREREEEVKKEAAPKAAKTAKPAKAEKKVTKEGNNGSEN